MVEVPQDREYAPDLDELLQRDDVAPTAVAVRAEGVTLTHELPSRSGLMRSLSIGDRAEQVLSLDLARKSGQLTPVNGPLWVGIDAQSVQDGSGVQLTSGQTLPILHCGAVWARCPTGGAFTLVNVLTAEYAD